MLWSAREVGVKRVKVEAMYRSLGAWGVDEREGRRRARFCGLGCRL